MAILSMIFTAGFFFPLFGVPILYISSIVSFVLSIIIGYKILQDIKDAVVFSVLSLIVVFILAVAFLVILTFSVFGFSPFTPGPGGVSVLGWTIIYGIIGIINSTPSILIGSILSIFIKNLRKPTSLSSPARKRYCMWCGSPMPAENRICPTCKKERPSGVDTKICPNCKAVIPKLAKFCNECGTAQP